MSGSKKSDCCRIKKNEGFNFPLGWKLLHWHVFLNHTGDVCPQPPTHPSGYSTIAKLYLNFPASRTVSLPQSSFNLLQLTETKTWSFSNDLQGFLVVALFISSTALPLAHQPNSIDFPLFTDPVKYISTSRFCPWCFLCLECSAPWNHNGLYLHTLTYHVIFLVSAQPRHLPKLQFPYHWCVLSKFLSCITFLRTHN